MPIQNISVESVPVVRSSAQTIPLKVQKKILLSALAICDAAAIVLALFAAYTIRYESSIPFFYYYDGEGPQQFYVALCFVLVPVWLGIFWIHRLYDWSTLLGGFREYAAVFGACLTGAISIAVAEFFIEGMPIARGWVGLFAALSIIFVELERFLMRRLAYRARQHGFLMANALIVGANDEGRAVGEQLVSWPTSGLNLIGYVDDNVPPGTRVYRDFRVVGPLPKLGEIIENNGVEELVVAPSSLSRNDLVRVFEDYGVSPSVNLRLSSGLFEILTTGLEVKEIAYVPLIVVNRVRLTGANLVIKTVLEYCLAIAALVALLPLLVAIATVIKLDSPGPVLYTRRVMGLHSKQFMAFKFRTMHVNGDQILKASPALADELATNHKIKADPRITRVGRWLRKYSLDELPQLLNVLRGEMSLVGPRMISPPELKNYGRFAMNLLTVRPGITGLWQVSGRSDISYEERIRLDMFYIRNYSIWLDLHLIMRTIPVVLSGKGAY